LPVAAALLWFFGVAGNLYLLIFAILISALAIWRHRSNIQRLRDGTEPRIERKK
jgi:glycerol-3-phosphate acyltransferase PlsY